MRLFCTTCRVLRCVLACSGRIRFVNNANHRGTNYIYNFYIFLHVGALIVKFNIRVLRKKIVFIFSLPPHAVLDTFPWHLPHGDARRRNKADRYVGHRPTDVLLRVLVSTMPCFPAGTIPAVGANFFHHGHGL